MSRECSSLETEGRIDSRHSAPFAWLIVCIGAFAVRPRRFCSGPLRFASNCLALVKRQQAESVVGVPTMVLSETSGSWPGLTAFLGCPRGHRVGSETWLKPNPFVDTRPRTRALHRRGDRRHLVTRNGCTGSALKLLVLSVCLGRSSLLSSKLLVRWRRSCAPASAAPSPAGCRQPAAPGKTPARVRRKCWHSWLHL